MADWTTDADVFGASQHASVRGYDLYVDTVVTSGDELEVGWRVERDGEEIDVGYIVPSEVGGLAAAFAAGRRFAEAAGQAARP